MSLGAGRAAIAAGALALALAALALWPGSPGGIRPRSRGLSILVADVSASVVRTRPAFGPWLRSKLAQAAEDAARRGQDVAVIRYAADVDVLHFPGDPDELLARIDGRSAPLLDPLVRADREGGSELARAVDVVEQLVAGRHGATVEIVSDGEFTGADPRGALARLAPSGDVVVTAPPAPELPDVRVVDFALPRRVEPGAPLAARVRIAWQPGRGGGEPELAVRLRIEDERGRRELEQRWPLPPGGPGDPPEIERSIALGPAAGGRTRVDVELALAGLPPGALDPVRENDRASAWCDASDTLRVLVLAPAERLATARAALPPGHEALAGLALEFAEPDAAARSLEGTRALVTIDVAPSELEPARIGPFVRGGGGWLALGGWAIAPGAPGSNVARDASAWDLLPLHPGAPDEEPRDVLLLVDGSGSMEGAPYQAVRTAAADLARAAPAADAIDLRFFAASLEPPIRLRASGVAADGEETARVLATWLDARPARGSTALLVALESLAAERSEPARRCLAFLLTDGRESGGREPGGAATPDDRIAAVLAALERARVELHPVAFGAAADTAFLERLSSPGRPCRAATDGAALADVLARGVQGERVRTGASIAVRAGAAPGPIASAAGGPGGVPPPAPIEAYVRCRPAPLASPGAEVLWTAPSGDPVLGASRVGLGATALLATMPGAGWATRLGAQDLAPIVRWLARGRSALGPRLALRGAELVLEDVPASWPARVVLNLRAAGSSADLEAELWLEAPAAASADVGSRSGPCPAELLAADAEAAFTATFGVDPGWSALVQVPRAPEFAGSPRRFGPTPRRDADRTALPALAGTRSSRDRTGLVLGAIGVALVAGGLRARARSTRGRAPDISAPERA